MRHTRHVRITARVDYAVRAMVVLAAAPTPTPIKAETVAAAQEIPLYFLLEVADLRPPSSWPAGEVRPADTRSPARRTRSGRRHHPRGRGPAC